MIIMRNCFLLLSCLLFAGYGHAQHSITVENLRCEYMKDPLGIDIERPRFGWEPVSSEAGKKQKAYQILVSTDARALAEDRADAWNSRKTASDATHQIVYNGTPLRANTLYYWKVRVWDEKGKPSAWSSTARFLVGPLTASDWQAQWIGEKDEPVAAEDRYYRNEGYRSQKAAQPDARKWIVVDLESVRTFDALKIYPIASKERLFPLRFTVETASSPDFDDAKTVVDESHKDNAVQSAEFYYKKLSAPVAGRYVRLNVTRLAPADRDDGLYEFGISELEVLSDRENIALHRHVSVSDTDAVDFAHEAQWITDEHIRPSSLKAYFDRIPPSPLLRKEIRVAKKVAAAFYSLSAQGFYEAYINGRKVGRQVLAPEYTHYGRHLQFQTFDVTDMLEQGVNALGAVLADGWYVGARWSFPNRGGYGYSRRFIGRLLIMYEDGTTEIVGTDGSWKMQPQGPIREASLFIGETYDAAYAHQGWDKPGYDDSEWRPVAVRPGELQNLCAQMNEPLAVIQDVKPVGVHKIAPHKYIFDLGINMVGWVRLELPYNPDRPVRLRYGEWLYDDGSLYTDNLRGAKQIDLYRPADEATVSWEPRFTYHGFRYVEVDGLTREPSLDNLLGRVVASSSPVVSAFECSDKDVNKLWENIRRTLWGNLTSIPTDCPQRDEREGWMADAQVFSQTAIYNLDMAGFYTKWARDIRDSQLEDGRLPVIAPHDGVWRDLYNAPGWADAGVIIPWRMYENYGDTTVLAQQYDAMKRFVDFNRRHNPDLIWRHVRGHNYNDWLNGDRIVADDYPTEGGNVPHDVFATAYFALSTDIVARSARVLGKNADYRYYDKLAADIRSAFVKEFVAPDGKITGDTQAGYAIALQFGLIPAHLRARAAAHMVDAIRRYDFRISTGIHATYMMMEQLVVYGYADIAWQLLLSRRFPSWLYSIDQGATTIWERWDGYVAGRGFQDAGMNSFNHVAIGAVGEWLYRHVLGIQADERHPAFRRFHIRPVPGTLAWAKGNYHSIHGNIEVAWTRRGSVFTLELTVPANTTADVAMPDGRVYEAAPGRHTFVADLTPRAAQ
ncbi:MAG: family 78 glycoside hydrolase catalytic domain [Tannerella sp.]|jgi:alpha-L-rhamnosidase|nr:family 78 glycoside hydrolase catalytic domain [Tannerella sp.]